MDTINVSKKDLELLINYLIEDERRHYEECNDKQVRKTHIYNVIKRLDKKLTKQV